MRCSDVTDARDVNFYARTSATDAGGRRGGGRAGGQAREQRRSAGSGDGRREGGSLEGRRFELVAGRLREMSLVDHGRIVRAAKERTIGRCQSARRESGGVGGHERGGEVDGGSAGTGGERGGVSTGDPPIGKLGRRSTAAAAACETTLALSSICPPCAGESK